ncbi:hypothetical protein K290105B7_31550 [Anaerostipes caccae]|uniref:Uncharacterized protein n=1 Tax=Anaerostipes caccae (strain DSM 14662 / CCUG 47493 / JCM 13470 / NCIMB 13811 / L1-92) TaxID=411490 RepID=B0MCZ9_ANACD|nr:hypothetical protein ANACAC_01441 [Anaerostipes caccae L1-92]BCD35784.1 hypothetical protein ANCC_18200 [Anaerostipes caccae L1-92]
MIENSFLLHQLDKKYRCEVLRKDENGKDLPQEDEQFLCYVWECYFKFLCDLKKKESAY